ncbi:MAG: phenylalanine--tRNA ligase subunit alpha, partial [Candidatus Hydrogenedentota bacterium]
MNERLRALRDEALGRIEAASAAELENLRVSYLGRKSELKSLLKTLGSLSPEERPAFGAAVNAAVREIEGRIEARLEQLSTTSSGPLIDFTRPGFARRQGLPHPIISTIEQITQIFVRLGYGVADGPDIEDDAHNFRDLNFPPDHPARDAQDTFFVKRHPIGDNPLLLRTHTSPVQIRVMEAMTPPLSIIIPGRTYRADAQDATHSPIFHQVEGLVVGYHISMADLKGTLEHFAQEFFGPKFHVRFRPSFFPFTEPSAEVDVSCVACRGDGR